MIQNLFDLSGKVALITGGNGGIGLGMAEGLASQGSEVSIWGTNEEKNAKALEKLNAYGPKMSALKCDVSSQEEVKASFNQTLATHGRVDGCFANAGIGGRATQFDQMEKAEWDRIIDVNLNGVFYTFKYAAEHMRERAGNGDPFGRLVATASLAAISGQARGEH